MPIGATQQMLKPIGGGIAGDVGELPAILAFGGAQQAGSIRHGSFVWLGPGKHRANALGQIIPIIFPGLHILFLQRVWPTRRGIHRIRHLSSHQ